MESTVGITGPALEWFCSYLGDRTLRVQIDTSIYSTEEGLALFSLCCMDIEAFIVQLRFGKLFIITSLSIYRLNRDQLIIENENGVSGEDHCLIPGHCPLFLIHPYHAIYNSY